MPDKPPAKGIAGTSGSNTSSSGNAVAKTHGLHETAMPRVRLF